MVDLDNLDRRIMFELDLNCRASAAAIGKKLRRSKETVNFRIKRLIDEGFIKGFYTISNTSKLGRFYYKLYVKFKDTTPDKETEIFAYLQQQPHIAYLADVEGAYDCVLLVMVRGAKDMTDFLYPFMKKYGDYVLQKDLLLFLTTHRMNQRFLYAGKESKDWYYPVEIGSYTLDSLDRKILREISSNARLSLIELARKTGQEPQTIQYRLRKLEKEGIILAYVTSPNFDKLGFQFSQLNISLKEPTMKKQIIEYFRSTDKCWFAIEALGKYDLIVEMHVKNNDELRGIIDDFRKKFVGVYAGYDLLSINKEYVIVWTPFSEKD